MSAPAPAAPRALLRPVLARLQAGEPVGAVATSLDLDPRLVDTAVAQLVRLGLVRVTGPGGGPGTSGPTCTAEPLTAAGARPCAGTPSAGPRQRLPLACAGCPLASRSTSAPTPRD